VQVLLLSQQALVFTSPTQGALDVIAVIMYIAAYNELHINNIVHGVVGQKYNLLSRPVI
jgi:hypothetical protein